MWQLGRYLYGGKCKLILNDDHWGAKLNFCSIHNGTDFGLERVAQRFPFERQQMGMMCCAQGVHMSRNTTISIKF